MPPGSTWEAEYAVDIVVVPALITASFGGPSTTHAVELTFVTPMPPAIEPVAPCHSAVAVRSSGPQTLVVGGTGLGVGLAGWGGGVASTHGITAGRLPTWPVAEGVSADAIADGPGSRSEAPNPRDPGADSRPRRQREPPRR